MGRMYEPKRSEGKNDQERLRFFHLWLSRDNIIYNIIINLII